MELPTTEEFTKLCNAHDWTYEYSDDHSVWKRGTAERDRLMAIVKEGGAEYGHIYNEIGKERLPSYG